MELSYEHRGRWRDAEAPLPGTGGRGLFVSADVWCAYRNQALKQGLQIPVYTYLNHPQARLGWRLVLAYELPVGGLLGR